MAYKSTERYIPKQRHKKLLILGLALLTLLGVYCSYVLVIKDYSYPLPKIKKAITGQPLAVQFPTYGNAGVKLVNSEPLFVKSTTQQPTASTIKLLTALLIAEELDGVDLTTQTFNVTSQHIAITDSYIARGGSVVPLAIGQTITYDDALSYILVRSANNITDIMVQEAFGRTENFFAYAKDFLLAHKLQNTTVTDPTGFAPTTVSSPTDLLQIAELALANPTIAELIKQKQVVLPNGTLANSTNFFLTPASGTVIGFKTGFTDEAKSVFIGGILLPNDDIITSVIMGADTALQSQSDALALANQITTSFQDKTVFDANATIATVPLPWGATIELYADTSITLPVYSFQNIALQIEPSTPTTTTINASQEPTLTLTSAKSTASYPLHVRNYRPPSVVWKLLHPLE